MPDAVSREVARCAFQDPPKRLIPDIGRRALSWAAFGFGQDHIPATRVLIVVGNIPRAIAVFVQMPVFVIAPCFAGRGTARTGPGAICRRANVVVGREGTIVQRARRLDNFYVHAIHVGDIVTVVIVAMHRCDCPALGIVAIGRIPLSRLIDDAGEHIRKRSARGLRGLAVEIADGIAARMRNRRQVIGRVVRIHMDAAIRADHFGHPARCVVVQLDCASLPGSHQARKPGGGGCVGQVGRQAIERLDTQ
ncbi:hypothetical protein CKU38_02620 [Xanthomonas citri pv. fuscans]|nr:hypothetical protein CKU38_02620 [Xanthomonas citri pv. fuscans]